MNHTGVIGSSPWYRSLDRVQWKALVASNLGWTFDGFEVFALILTVGIALRQLLDTAQYPLIPAYAGAVIAITVLGLGDWWPDRGRACRLHRPQAHNGAGDPCLLVDDRVERTFVGLAVLCGAAFSCRGRDRLGVGDRGLAYG